MRGLVLEGGGAKGAFHLGAVKALYDYGYTFDGVSGTSIGAINGAIIAQEGGYQTLYNLWSNISPSDFTDFDDMMVAKMQNKEYDKETIIYWMKQSLKILKNVGVPTDKIIPFLKQYIDENQLRNSKIDYALVTYSVSDKKPMELYKEDIPYGKLHDYIFASAYYPAFRLNRLNGKFFVDGGVCDNLPLNTLARKGYDELFAIRTMSRMPHSIVADKSVKVIYICPSEDLGGTTELNSKLINNNIKLGYYDALRYIKNYLGNKYYIESDNFTYYEKILLNLEKDAYENIKEILELDKELDKQAVVTALFAYFKSMYLLDTDSRRAAFIYFLESFAKLYGVEKYKIYNIDEFYTELRYKYLSHNPEIRDVKKKLFINQKTKHQLIFNEIMRAKGEKNEI